jgi:flagellar assembly protein FliH
VTTLSEALFTRAARTGGGAWQRWEMAAIASARAPRHDAPRPEPALEPRPAIDAAELARLREQARAEAAAQGHAQGLAAGHAEGHAAGLAAGRAEIEAQAAHWLALARSLPLALKRADAAIAADVVALALDVARQVIGQAYETQPALLLPLVRELLRQEPALQGEPRLLLHPQDAELVAGALGPELAAAGWQLRADAAIARGGCLVRAGDGTHDATLPTRWARVSAAMLAAAEAPPAAAPAR